MILDFIQNKQSTGGGAIPPIMGGTGSTTVTSITDTTAVLTGEWLNDGGSPITATGFVLYPTGNPTYTIGSPGVTNFPDATLPNPISANATGLTGGTGYCVRAYATNAVGTSYGVEVCFTTAAYIYVSNANAAGTVSKINTSTNTIVGTVSVGNTPRDMQEYNGYLYVLNNSVSTVSKIDLSTFTLSATITVGAAPEDIIFNGGFGYVASRGSGTVTKFNPVTNAVLATIPCTAAAGMTIIGSLMYVTRLDALGNISIVDLTTDTVIGTITGIGGNTYHIINDVTNLYITRYLSSSMVKINIATGTIVGTIATGLLPTWLDWDGGLIYVIAQNGNTLYKVDPSGSMSILGSIAITNPTDLVTKAGFAYVVSNGTSTVRKISLPSLTLSATYTTNPAGHSVYIP